MRGGTVSRERTEVVTDAGVMRDHHRPAIGVVVDGHARAAHASFLDHAISRVVHKLEALAVLVDQGLDAMGRVVGQGHRALLGITAGNGLAARIECEACVALNESDANFQRTTRSTAISPAPDLQPSLSEFEFSYIQSSENLHVLPALSSITQHWLN